MSAIFFFQRIHRFFEFQATEAIESASVNKELNGRRIVDIMFLFQQFKEISEHSKVCRFSALCCIKEVNKGLNAIFTFNCQACRKDFRIRSEATKSMGVNETAIMGIISIGLGFSHLEEYCAHMSIPTIKKKTFDVISKQKQDDWWLLARKMQTEALEDEKQIAQQKSRVDDSGNVHITAVGDGSWSKRSYGKFFSSLSGCAILIGSETKKVIYFDIKSKYCDICKMAQARVCPVREHVCNRNFDGYGNPYPSRRLSIL